MILTPFLYAACLSLCAPTLQDAPVEQSQEPEAPKTPAAAEPAKPTADLRLHAERVYTGTGEILKNALIEVRDGKISSLRPGRSVPEGVLQVKAITAGMIDLSARVHTNFSSVEQSSEVQPHLDVAGSVDLYDKRFARLARTGVTTVLINPLDRNVIGGRGVALKTHGPMEVEARRLKGRIILRGAIGSEPSAANHPAFGRPTDFFSRRPTTRMGVEWEWRKAFFDAVAAQRLPEKDFPGAGELRAALAGERTVIIQAWTTQDIRTAVYLDEEMQREGFGDLDLVIDAGAEAWKEPAFLVRNSTPVILPPHSAGGRVGSDNAFFAWNTASQLVEQGLTVCLSAHGAGPGPATLGHQAGFAMRGGLSFDQALAAVTSAPAALLGLSDRLGTVAEGMDADLALWNGRPFASTSRVTGVVIDGNLVVDPR
jgi:imidazolonepropionase-like amidohydrolase